MSQDHSHEIEKFDSKLKLGLFLNTSFTVIEFIVGFMSGSLALISDAAHNLTDSLSLLISFLAQRMSTRASTPDKTYGYGRSTILAALINSVILIALALFIFYEAYERMLSPYPVNGALIALVSLLGILINGTIAYLFKNSIKDLNMKSVFLSMLFDMLAATGAFIAGIIIYFTHLVIFDSIVSLIIGLMLLFGACGVLKDALHILFEGTPRTVDFEKVKKAILDSFPEITNVHDLHIWSISSSKIALSCHITVKESETKKAVDMVTSVKKILHDQFEIEHSTIEIELETCVGNLC
jgi:cobalt-zinc-cadmium efflux system protein